MPRNQLIAASICQLWIHLRGVSSPIWRRVWLSPAITIAGLLDIVREAMGWEDIHLHEFTIL